MAFKAKPRSEMDISACSDKKESDVNGVRLQGEDPKEEESSSTSSFGDSMCSSDNDGENEAHSRLCREYPLPEIFDYGTELLGLRKKKVTQEWRRSTQPLSWRCKWLELKSKELLSHSRWYDNKANDKSQGEGVEEKSIPLTFKRGRRKRVEETTDVAAYRSNHSIFAYADKRMQATVKPHDSDFGRGRKATSKEDGNEDDCLVSELDCSKDFLPSLLCEIEEAQERAARLQNRVDQLMMESQTAPTSSTPQTVAILQKDVTVEEALTPHTAARNQKEATVQIGRQRISADHTEDVLVPPVQMGGQCLNNYSPISSGGFSLNNILEDLLMDEPDMNEEEIDMDDYFRKVMNDITGVVSPEEADTEEDHTPVNKRRKTSDD